MKKASRKCLQCGAVTSNKRFCSHSCNTTYRNVQISIARKNYCIRCGELSGIGPKKKYKYCAGCKPANGKHGRTRYVELLKLTLKELEDLVTIQYKRAVIATSARKIHKAKFGEGKQPCVNCGYSKHTEVCHRKAVASYPQTALLSEVNDISNLVSLCRNCHWEYDHGMLNL